MVELNIAPTSTSYRMLMLVHTVSGEPEQLARVDSLYAEMCSGGGPAGHRFQFSIADFQSLINAAHCCRLADEVRKWLDRADSAGLLHQLRIPSPATLEVATPLASSPHAEVHPANSVVAPRQ